MIIKSPTLGLVQMVQIPPELSSDLERYSCLYSVSAGGFGDWSQTKSWKISVVVDDLTTDVS